MNSRENLLHSHWITANRHLTSEDGTKTVDINASVNRQGAVLELEPYSVWIKSRPFFNYVMFPCPDGVQRAVAGWVPDMIDSAGQMEVEDENDAWQAVQLWKVIEISILEKETQGFGRAIRQAKKDSFKLCTDEEVDRFRNLVWASEAPDDVKRGMVLSIQGGVWKARPRLRTEQSFCSPKTIAHAVPVLVRTRQIG